MWTPPERIKHPLPEPGWPTAEEAAKALLFRPIRIGPVVAAQRTWVPAMVPWRATEDGLVTDDVIDWYARFAAGRPGVLVVEATGIRDIPSGPLLRIGHDRFIPGLEELVRVVHDRSGGRTRLFIQVIDFLTVRRRPSPARYFADYLEVTPTLRRRLADVLADPRWLDAGEADVRACLARGERPLVEAALGARELEA